MYLASQSTPGLGGRNLCLWNNLCERKCTGALRHLHHSLAHQTMVSKTRFRPRSKEWSFSFRLMSSQKRHAVVCCDPGSGTVPEVDATDDRSTAGRRLHLSEDAIESTNAICPFEAGEGTRHVQMGVRCSNGCHNRLLPIRRA